MLGNGRTRRPRVRVSALALAISSIISIGAVISAKADDDDLKKGTFIPTGVQITPSAASGSSFQALNPGLSFDPSFTVGQAVTTAISPSGTTLLILTSGYNSQNFTSGPNKGNTNPDESNEYIFVFDISGGKPLQTQVLQVPNAFDGLAFNPRYLLTALRASQNHEGDTFRGQLAEPVRVAGRMFAPGTLVEGTVVRSVAPRMLSRAGKLYLRVDRILPRDGEPLRVVGSMSAAETDAQARFALDEEGTLHGRKPGMVNGLVDLGYAYALGKVSDDIAETPIRAIGASMSNAAVANAARYVGLGTSVAFLLTRHGRDVYLAKYSLIEFDLGRVSKTASTANRD